MSENCKILRKILTLRITHDRIKKNPIVTFLKKSRAID